MKRTPHTIKHDSWDLIIIGGGITGAGILRDAAMRGIKALLLDKGDFSHATSSATSKLAHGGLRYLKTADFALVRESLRERRTLEEIAPHIVNPLPFLLPIYKQKALLHAGMWLYDLLSFDKARIADPSKRLPRFKMLSAQATLLREPGIDPKGLQGGALYYDCQIVYPDRVCLEYIRDATSRGSRALNYAKVETLIRENDIITGVQVRDLTTGETFSVKGRLVVNATGPWTDLVLSASGTPFSNGVRRSKGIHLVTRAITKNTALVLETKTGRTFFVLPWRGFSIIGTTDTDYPDMPDNLCVTEQDRDTLLRELNDVYPTNLSAKDILYSYVGIRPLVEEFGKDSTQLSRKYEIYDHAEHDHVRGLLTVIGGKWTTTRHLAEVIVNRIEEKLNRSHVSAKTQSPLDCAPMRFINDYIDQEQAHWKNRVSANMIRSLIATYGRRYRDVLETYILSDEAIDRGDASYIKVGDDEIALGQIVDAVENEMAIRLDDVLRRRTGLGTLGQLSRDQLERIATRMGELLGWDEAKRNEEIAYYVEKASIQK